MSSPLYTIGYEGASLNEFLDALQAHHIGVVVDVRELPLSRKRGFSKTALQEALADRKIRYVHLRALGCPRDIRHQYREDKDWQRYTRLFLEYLGGQHEALVELAEIAETSPCALVCYEADAQHCHRSFVSEAVMSHSSALSGPVHLAC